MDAKESPQLGAAPFRSSLRQRLVRPFLENASEATAACLLTMTQGSLLAITLGHWLVASQTGLIAGTVTSAILLGWRALAPWIAALVLGVATAIADFLVHPGEFGPLALEAVVTGIAAATLSYLVSLAFRRIKARKRPCTMG